MQAAIYFEGPKTIVVERQKKISKVVDVTLSKAEIKNIIQGNLLEGPITINIEEFHDELTNEQKMIANQLR